MMQVPILPVFLLLSSSLLFSAVRCNPSHHHINHNDFPWQNILSSLGIVIENQTGVVSTTEANVDNGIGHKEYTSESPVEILKLEATDRIETPIIVQNGTRYDVTYGNNNGLGTGYKVGIPIASIAFVILFWYCVCKYCCCCCQRETPGFVVVQNTAQPQQPPPVPQIIVQQPIIHQQAPPMYEASQRWTQPQPQGPHWNQPPQGVQWAPHPMGQQQEYSPHSGYDNAGFDPATAPPPYNPGKY